MESQSRGERIHYLNIKVQKENPDQQGTTWPAAAWGRPQQAFLSRALRTDFSYQLIALFTLIHRSPWARPFTSPSLCLCVYLQNQGKSLSCLPHRSILYNTKHYRNVRYKSTSMILRSVKKELMMNVVTLELIWISWFPNTSVRLGDHRWQKQKQRPREKELECRVKAIARGQEGTVPALPTIGPWPCAKPLSVKNCFLPFVITNQKMTCHGG